MAKRKNNAGTVKKKQITEKNPLSLLRIYFCMNTSLHIIQTCR